MERKPIIVAGPCSAESEEQVLGTALSLSRKVRPEYFRAGLWKPRTHPGCFEGVGSKGLAWLRRVRMEIPGQKVCTEALSPSQAEECLKEGIDMLWLGARTTSNPFLVQEICSALKGSPIPVFVKNPISPDIELWAGAVERLQASGISGIVLVHRGFGSLEKGRYRNEANWGAVAAIRSLFPSLPLITDPSHIAGSAALVGEVCARACALGCDGLMVETHCNPSSALSDAAQQITPDELESLLGSLSFRQTEGGGEFLRNLEALRARIDELDTAIITALSSRMQASREIGRLKSGEGVSILQSGRWTKVLNSVLNQAESKGLDREFVREIYGLIHARSIEEQKF